MEKAKKKWEEAEKEALLTTPPSKEWKYASYLIREFNDYKYRYEEAIKTREKNKKWYLKEGVE